MCHSPGWLVGDTASQGKPLSEALWPQACWQSQQRTGYGPRAIAATQGSLRPVVWPGPLFI